MSTDDAGLTDEGRLTRWANELFKDSSGSGGGFGAPDVSHLSAVGLPHVQGLPQVHGLPVGLGVPTPHQAPSIPGVPSVVPAPSVVSSPSVPDPRVGLGVPTPPPYQAASIFGVPSAVPAPSVVSAPSAVPGEGPRVGAAFDHGVVPVLHPLQDEPTRAPRSPFSPFSAEEVRADFPILREKVEGKDLVWLDNAATTQKPQSVIDRISYYYTHENSNVHRAAHTLAERATEALENSREKVQRFLGAPSVDDIVFVRGATEAINLVAQSWGRKHIRSGDEIIVSVLEHHSNIVPWQLLCAESGARLKVAPVDDRGQILLDEFDKLFTSRTRLAAFTHVSNALGTVLPVREMVAIAHRHGALALVDGAQAVPHFKVDLAALDPDFYVFSGHKLFGPTGIGALYGRQEVLKEMPPWQGGGNMISDVTFERTVYNPPPSRFEAGTGNIADAAGLGAAIDYLDSIGFESAARYEHDLLKYAEHQLLEIPGLKIIGTASEKAGLHSFVMDGLSPAHIGKALADEGIAVRAGHHCAQPALRRFGLEATVRPSFAFYNTRSDVDALIRVLWQLRGSRK